MRKRIIILLTCLLLTACGISEEDVEGTVVAAIEDFAATQTAIDINEESCTTTYGEGIWDAEAGQCWDFVIYTETPTAAPSSTPTPTPTPSPIPTEKPKPIRIYGVYVSRSGYKIVYPNSWMRCIHQVEEEVFLDMCADDLDYIDWIGTMEDDTIALGLGPMTFDEYADLDLTGVKANPWDVFDLLDRYQMYEGDMLWEIKQYYYGPDPGIWYSIRGVYEISSTRFLMVVVGTNRLFADRANEVFFNMLDQIEPGYERTDPLGYHSWEMKPLDTQEG